MAWPTIRKSPEERARANVQDYDAEAGGFSWVEARRALAGLPGGALNIAHEALDRHVIAGRGAQLALRWIGRDDAVRDFTYAELTAQANRPISCGPWA